MLQCVRFPTCINACIVPRHIFDSQYCYPCFTTRGERNTFLILDSIAKPFHLQSKWNILKTGFLSTRLLNFGMLTLSPSKFGVHFKTASVLSSTVIFLIKTIRCVWISVGGVEISGNNRFNSTSVISSATVYATFGTDSCVLWTSNTEWKRSNEIKGKRGANIGRHTTQNNSWDESPPNHFESKQISLKRFWAHFKSILNWMRRLQKFYMLQNSSLRNHTIMVAILIQSNALMIMIWCWCHEFNAQWVNSTLNF